MRVNKRMFLKSVSWTLAPAMLRRALAWASAQKLTNWAGNFEFSTSRVYEAGKVEQIRNVVKAQNKLKVLGTRHCFNRIADSADALLSLKSMDDQVALDPKARTVSVNGNITYGRLAPYL